MPAAVEVEDNTESSERPERKKSAVATLFVNLARTPSRAARSFRKRSKAAAAGTPALPTKAGEEVSYSKHSLESRKPHFKIETFIIGGGKTC